jgi:hypothetical protein
LRIVQLERHVGDPRITRSPKTEVTIGGERIELEASAGVGRLIVVKLVQGPALAGPATNPDAGDRLVRLVDDPAAEVVPRLIELDVDFRWIIGRSSLEIDGFGSKALGPHDDEIPVPAGDQVVDHEPSGGIRERFPRLA